MFSTRRASRRTCSALIEANPCRGLRAVGHRPQSPQGLARNPLVDRDIRVADDAAPLVALALRVFGESFRRPTHGFPPLIGELLAHFGRAEDRVDLAIE